jgi:glucose-1-phosphate thymidylyltransferase
VEKQLKVKILSRGATWLDMGTPSSLLSAAAYVQIIQERQGLLVGSPEEASWRSNWIDDNELTTLASEFSNTNYGELLRNLPLEGK